MAYCPFILCLLSLRIQRQPAYLSIQRDGPGLPLPGVADWEGAKMKRCHWLQQAGNVLKLEWAGGGMGFPLVRIQNKLGEREAGHKEAGSDQEASREGLEGQETLIISTTQLPPLTVGAGDQSDRLSYLQGMHLLSGASNAMTTTETEKLLRWHL